MTSVAPRLDSLATLPTLPKAAQLHGWRRTFYRFRQRKSAVVALGFVLLMVLIGILAPVLAPHDPSDQLFLQDRFAGFSGDHLLGTDHLGRDVLSRMMFGLRTSLLACLLAVVIAVTAGFILGVLSGYLGGVVDALLMRLVDGILSIPGLLMVMAIVGILGPGLRNAMIGLSIVFTPVFARLVRGQVLSTKEDVYVEAARVMGAKDSRIVFRHIVPNSIAPIIVQALMTMGLALLVEGTLSYLGLSVKPPKTSLGSLLQNGFAFKERSQRMILLPGITITLLSWAFNVIADGLRDAIGRQEIGGGRVTLLEVDSLGVEVKRYGKWVRVIDDVSFAIAEGETLGLVGESGSGKSLTASAVMNLLPHSVRRCEGTVAFEGRVISTLSQPDFRQMRGPKMAMVFQDPQNSLNPAYTVGNQLVEAIRTHHDMNKREATDRAVELLERVGIKHPRDRLGDYPHQFSGGMAQRVMIALAISSQPRLLIADEPTTALDVTVQAQILRLMHSLRDEFGMSLLLISHDLSVIAEMCDRVAVMYAGQLVETGDTRKVFVVPTHPYTEALLGSHPGPHTKGGVLIAIPGTVPDPSAMPTGCRFHTRCQYAIEACVDAPPPLIDRGGTQVRCIRVGEILLQGARSGTAPESSAPVEASHREPLLVVSDLTKDYKVGGGVFGRAKRTIRAVDTVNIDVLPGESVGLVGESGAGKTTVGRLVLGLVTPSSGTVLFEGVDSSTLSKSALRAQRRDIQVIYQNPYASLDPQMTVGDSVAEPLDIHMKLSADERRERITELLGQVGLDETYRYRYPHQLSGGQRQRVAIARALALKPKLIVCDEPISSLDVSTQAQVINLLNDLKRETGIAYLFVGHDLEVVHHISDRVAVMYLGRVVEWGPSEEVYANPRHPYTRMLLGSVLSMDPTNRRLMTMPDDSGTQQAPPAGGCPFAPRCPDVIDACLTTDPAPVSIRGVSVRCLRVAPEMAGTH